MVKYAFDSILGAMENLSPIRRAQEIERCQRFAFDRIRASGRTFLTRGAALEDTLRRSNTQIIEELRRLHRRNTAYTLLQCARRVPPDVLRAFLDSTWRSPIDDLTHEHVFAEQALLSANLALTSRFTTPTNEERITERTLLDGIAVACLCALHRTQTVLLNTVHREGISSPLSAGELINSYVHRNRRQRNVRPELEFDGTQDRIVGLTSRSQFGITALEIDLEEYPEGATLYLRGYLPLAKAAAPERVAYGWLDHPSTSSYLNGLPFTQWWECWLLLNRIALEWLPKVLTKSLRLPNRTPEEKAAVRLCFEIHNMGMAKTNLAELRSRRTLTNSRTIPPSDVWDSFLSTKPFSNLSAASLDTALRCTTTPCPAPLPEQGCSGTSQGGADRSFGDRRPIERAFLYLSSRMRSYLA
jgi:hypothetical protein